MAEMLNPLNSKQLSRLRAAMDHSRRKLKPFRENTLKFLQEYVGKHYGENSTKEPVPVNLIALATAIYVRTLAARTPAVMVSTPHTQLKPAAYELELALDHLLNEIQFRSTLQMGVINSIFSMGIFKVGICQYDRVEIEGVHHDVGQPFVDAVHIDDWVHDVNSRNFEQIQFCGDRYRLPLEFVKDSDLYDAAARDRLSATDGGVDENGDERSESLSKGTSQRSEDYRETVELWDLWIPQDGLIVTLAADGEGPPLRVAEWEGPENGPYHLLRHNDVPNNLLPSPPASLWYDLHTIANRIWRKLGRQADRQKTVVAYAGAAEGDARRLQKVDDGEMFRTDAPDKVREMRFGGIDQPSLMYMMQCKDLFSYLAGNLDTLGGLSPQANTLGQEKLLTDAASKLLTEMQDRTVECVEGILKDVAWWLWTDPLIQIPLTKPVPGTDLTVQSTFSEESKEGDFLDYNFKIKPYSMQHTSPGDKLQALTNFWNSFVGPNLQFMAQAGIQPNWEGLLRNVAKLTDMDEIDELLVFGGPPMAQRPEVVGQDEKGSAQPQHTTRTYERISRPGATSQGKTAGMMAALMGTAQPKEMAGAMRPVG